MSAPPGSDGEAIPLPTSASASARVAAPTPVLDQFARDLTTEVVAGELPAVVGRETETQVVIETLCRTTRRYPLLIGPAGVGKTAVVEGLAQRIARGDVPAALRGARVVALQAATLLTAAGQPAGPAQRVATVLAEARQDGLILFIDDLHLLLGAGGQGLAEVVAVLKPALAQGALTCIGATTEEEYRRSIEPDGLLERRFQPLRVAELTAEQTLPVLHGLRDVLRQSRGVAVSDELLRVILDFAQDYLRNRAFPEKALDLLEQCIAYVVANGRTALAHADVEAVVQRMVGFPLALDQRLGALRARLTERVPLADADAAQLLDRLEVTARGLDLHRARPDAIVLLVGDAVEQSDALAATIAEALAGAADRVVTLDCSHFVDESAVAMLLGAPPGYAGSADLLPLQRVAQMPWCVLRCLNLHACHPRVRELLTQAFAAGSLTDARGKQIFLSDTVVLLTADIAPALHRRLGFPGLETPASLAAQEVREAVARTLGAELLDLCDVVCATLADAASARARWIERTLLPELAARYRQHGLDLHWDPSVVAWLVERQPPLAQPRAWEDLVDEHLAPLLIPYLPEEAVALTQPRPVTLAYAEDRLQVHAGHADAG